MRLLTMLLLEAERLAESRPYSVAVIEAGRSYELDNGNLSTIPGYGAYWLGTAPKERNPLVDWEIYTEPMAVGHIIPPMLHNVVWIIGSRTQGLNSRNLLYTQGKTLGGSSARNLPLYMR